jgi:hypothetical protein
VALDLDVTLDLHSQKMAKNSPDTGAIQLDENLLGTGIPNRNIMSKDYLEALTGVLHHRGLLRMGEYMRHLLSCAYRTEWVTVICRVSDGGKNISSHYH